MKQLVKSGTFEFRKDTAFEQVIACCQRAKRPGQEGTWITNEVVAAYTNLHRSGYAHCAETWLDGKLVGGLYGVRMGNMFFGESKFSDVSNASKYAFIRYVQHLRDEGVVLIDCQVYTEHLETLGARMISRIQFLSILSKGLGQ
jgi:leucyl/phenylalanyl-tRNA--protein transferase